MNLARSCSRSLVSLLEVAKKTLNFFMTTWCGNVCKLRTIDMLHVRQLANWLVDNTLRVVWRLGHSSLTLAMLNLAWCSSGWRTPSGTWCCLLVFLEVEARSCSILLRFWGDDTLVTTLSVWQMPLLWARPILRVLASSFHMQWIFADQLDCATLVRLLLRLISGWHDSIRVLVMNSSMIVSLLVSSNASSNWEVTLHVYLWSGSRSLWRTLGLLISAQLPATVKSARVLHDSARRAISAVVVWFRHADDLLSRGPRGWALVSVGASNDWVSICCAQSCTICNASLIRKRPIQIISVRSSSDCTWFSTLKPFLAETVCLELWLQISWASLEQIVTLWNVLESLVQTTAFFRYSIAGSDSVRVYHLVVRCDDISLRNNYGLPCHRGCFIRRWSSLHDFL